MATVVHLLEMTLIRVGNDDYAKAIQELWADKLKNRHVAAEGSEVRFRFTGKSGKQWALKARYRLAKIIKACQELPVRSWCSTSTRTGSSTTNPQDVTAKDFILASRALKEVESFDIAAQAKKETFVLPMSAWPLV